jgi:hypothetical protein
MPNKKRQWNLERDNVLCKEVMNAVDDPTFVEECKRVIACVNEKVDPNDGLQLLIGDCAAAEFISKKHLLRYASSQARINSHYAREWVETEDESIRDALRKGVAFPTADVADRVIKHGAMHDRQIQKYLQMLDEAGKRANEKAEIPSPQGATLEEEEPNKKSIVEPGIN